MNNDEIIITGLHENNLKNVDLRVRKQQITVFTGVSGSGKSSIVFDTIANESQRQMNESYPPFIRSRLPKHPKPHAEKIENLTASVIVDQSSLGGNARSTVGTITDLYASLRVVFSRIGTPYAGSASHFSFNSPNGMCRTCSGLGKVTRIDIAQIVDTARSLNDGAILHSMYKRGGYFYGQLIKSGFFDADKPICEYSAEEYNLLMYGNRAGLTATDLANGTGNAVAAAESGNATALANGANVAADSVHAAALADGNATKDSAPANPAESTDKKKNGTPKTDPLRESKYVEGLIPHFTRLFLNRDMSDMSSASQEHQDAILIEELCPDCKGLRLNKAARECRINGYSICDLSTMEFSELRAVLGAIHDERVGTVLQTVCATLDRMIQIGLPYLHLNRETTTLSGGEAQRLKLVRYMGSSLTDMTYIFDEPSTGLHPRDVGRMNALLQSLRDKGNTVLVVEHDKDVISIADAIVDVGPRAGRNGGEIVFTGSYDELLHADTLTARAMKQQIPYKKTVRTPKAWFSVEHASLNNAHDVSFAIPEGVLTVVTGVAGSGKSTLISHCFAEAYKDRVVKIDQGPITATNRSIPASYLGFFDDIRKLFALCTGNDASLFSFNSKGACPACGGKGMIVTELVFMDPIVTTCEVCGGNRYNEQALGARVRGKSILDVLGMSADCAAEFFASFIEDEVPNRVGERDSDSECGAFTKGNGELPGERLPYQTTETAPAAYDTRQTDAIRKLAKKILTVINTMTEVGLPYLTLGQTLSTLSGGERQRIKLAKHLGKKGNIYILDEPTTGLHASDTEKLLELFERMVSKGNTVVIIEHNLDVAKRADYVLDIGPDGGKNGGRVVFAGTPREMHDNAHTITADWLRKAD